MTGLSWQHINPWLHRWVLLVWSLPHHFESCGIKLVVATWFLSSNKTERYMLFQFYMSVSLKITPSLETNYTTLYLFCMLTAFIFHSLRGWLIYVALVPWTSHRKVWFDFLQAFPVNQLTYYRVIKQLPRLFSRVWGVPGLIDEAVVLFALIRTASVGNVCTCRSLRF